MATNDPKPSELEQRMDQLATESAQTLMMRLYREGFVWARWHKTTDDNLPPVDKVVLIHTEKGGVWFGYLDTQHWRYADSYILDNPPTHWAELPAAPIN